MRSHHSTVLLIAAAATLAVSCTEPQRAPSAAPSPASVLDARVEVSNATPAAGATVLVTVRYLGPAIASTTARLTFDSLAFAFAGEETLDDGATRVLNPAPGLVRFAALAPSGFNTGRVYAMRFTALRATAASFRLTVDEAHTAAGGDARATMVRAAP